MLPFQHALGRLLSSHAITGALWIFVYLVLTLAPLGIVMIAPAITGVPMPAGRSFWTEFSVALGFVGLSTMCLQFVLTARFSFLKAPYGSDIIYQFHKVIAIFSLGLILLHPLVLFVERWDTMKDRWHTHPWAFWTGTASIVSLLLLILVSVYRAQLRMEYDRWRRWHAILGVLAIAFAVVHVMRVGHYLAEPLQRWLWGGYTLAWLALIVHVRLLKPLREVREPYEVVSVRPQLGGAAALTIRPVLHSGVRFQPGQFAWLTAFSSPLSDREHPFSFSSSAERPEVEFTIKNLGDFSSRIPTLLPGQRVYIDGPFGALSADRHPHAPGYVFIAGGIGITPMISHLRTFADRQARDRAAGRTPQNEPHHRPLWLFYATKAWGETTYREELAELARELPNLHLVHVLSRPDDGWAGERGMLTADVIRRHVDFSQGRYECFICGPPVMMDAVERVLRSLGVPIGDIHAEKFNLV
jgi:predicted ferric reductase